MLGGSTWVGVEALGWAWKHLGGRVTMADVGGYWYVGVLYVYVVVIVVDIILF